MPEVIEVKEYSDFIQKHIKNEKCKKIEILSGRYKKHGPFKGYHSFNTLLPLRVSKVHSKGKFMYISFENDMHLGITLGLTGGWFFSPKGSKEYIHGLNGDRYVQTNIEKYRERALKHLNVAFFFQSGTLYFYDQLSFGTISLFKSTQELEKKLKGLGLDIMDEETTYEMFESALLHKSNLSKPIGNALMNQKYISGIGNYLRADALWLSKVNPFTKVKDLTKSEIKKIYSNVRLLIWGQYNKKRGIKLGIIKKSDKLPADYGRNFFVYQQETTIDGKEVKKEKLYEGSQVRYIYW